MSKKSGKSISLGEKFSSLIQTKPKEIESDEEDDFTKVENIAHEWNSDVSADELDVTKFRKINNKLLDEEDSKYVGKSISRKDLSDFDSDESRIDDEENVSVGDSENEYDSEENEQYEENSNEEELEENSDEESVKSESDEPSQIFSKDNTKDLEKQDNEVDFTKEISLRVEQDIEKGKAIKTQLLLWNFFLECRMKLQNCLLASNQLPNHKNYYKFKGNSTFDESVTQTKKSLKHLLKSLLSLQEQFLSSNEEFVSSLNSSKKNTLENDDDDDEIKSDSEVEDDNNVSDTDIKIKNINIFQSHFKKLNDFSNEINKRHKNFEAYRNSTIQKWDDKTRIGFVSSKNFSAFEQSALKQIDQILVDKQRLITRTQTKRSFYHILGSDPNDGPPAKKQTHTENEESDVTNLQRSKTITDKEIFDDDDFYHQLLSELIKRKASEITDPVQLGRQWMQLQKIRSKLKKIVDTRASKARKVRFVVHPKLVNFMMPTCDQVYSENSRIELINSIFGKKK